MKNSRYKGTKPIQHDRVVEINCILLKDDRHLGNNFKCTLIGEDNNEIAKMDIERIFTDGEVEITNSNIHMKGGGMRVFAVNDYGLPKFNDCGDFAGRYLKAEIAQLQWGHILTGDYYLKITKGERATPPYCGD